MYIGPFYFDTKELFLVLLTVMLSIGMYLGWTTVPFFNIKDLFTITILILFTKGLLPAIHNEAFFMVAFAAVLCTIYLQIFQVVLFYFISFVLFRMLKVI
ncbi:MAG: hypothetical protein WCJ70_00750 [bacterium]